MSPFPDSQPLTDEQKKKLCHMLFEALLQIRYLGWNGSAQQAADLADTFHELPTLIWYEHFSLDVFRESLELYCKKYLGAFDYLAAVDEVRRMIDAHQR